MGAYLLVPVLPQLLSMLQALLQVSVLQLQQEALVRCLILVPKHVLRPQVPLMVLLKRVTMTAPKDGYQVVRFGT